MISNLQWQGNSKKMYDSILKSIPLLFRSSINNNIEKWIYKNNIKIITEDIVFKAVDDIAPFDLANKRIKPELQKLRKN